MLKKIVSIVAVISIIAVFGVCLSACNADTYVESLEKAGYTVESWEGEEAKEETDSDYDVKWAVFAAKGATLDIVSIVCFKNTDDAKEYEAQVKEASGVFGYSVERSLKTVFVGTEQAIKDAK